jgi:hypothetical protein
VFLIRGAFQVLTKHPGAVPIEDNGDILGPDSEPKLLTTLDILGMIDHSLDSMIGQLSDWEKQSTAIKFLEVSAAVTATIQWGYGDLLFPKIAEACAC